MEIEIIFTIIAIVVPIIGAFLSLLLKKWTITEEMDCCA